MMASLNTSDINLWNLLKRLETIVSFLNTGAHPDDERSDLLSYLTHNLGVKTYAMIANRGEGGQNQIGKETGDALGVLRTKEMAQAAQILGTEVFHLSEEVRDSIYDHGIEKTAQATLAKWGQTKTYERMIRKIRELKPDIVMPCFRDHDMEHGHHRAITSLTLQAFHDAADPTIYPEHLTKGIHAWQIKKLYLPAETETQTTLNIEIGSVDPTYGRTYPQIGEASRALHKTQGMGVELSQEARRFPLELVESVRKTETDSHLFANISFDFSEFATERLKDTATQRKLIALQAQLKEIVEAFPNRANILTKIIQTIPYIESIVEDVHYLELRQADKIELLHKLNAKLKQLNEIGFLATDVTIEPISSINVITKGETTDVRLKVTNHGETQIPLVFTEVMTPENWIVSERTSNLSLNPKEEKMIHFTVTAPTESESFNPYEASPISIYITLPFGTASFTHIETMDELVFLPELSVALQPDHIVLNTRQSKKEISIDVFIKNYAPKQIQARIQLDIPDGWQLINPYEDILLTERNEEKTVSFTLIPPAHIEAGETWIRAFATTNLGVFSQSIQEITYPHIGTTYFEYEAGLKATAFDLAVPQTLRIGYIESGFDKVADALLACDFSVTKLAEIDLAVGNLSVYDTIVIGIRAYLSRKDLQKHHDRILEYVKQGGHVVVQYHKPTDGIEDHIPAPYPLKLGTPSIRWRIADEQAKVHVVNPESPLFTFPNQIFEADWENWVQERGLYFPMTWSEQFETVVQIADDNEQPLDGGILVANYGKGTYVYTNLVFYRQIQNQVAGGYRMFTNLLSYGIYEKKRKALITSLAKNKITS